MYGPVDRRDVGRQAEPALPWPSAAGEVRGAGHLPSQGSQHHPPVPGSALAPDCLEVHGGSHDAQSKNMICTKTFGVFNMNFQLFEEYT